MEYTPEFLKNIADCGSLGFECEKIIIAFKVENPEEFRRDFYDENSIIFKEYQRGILRAEFAISKAIYKKAETGDIEAIKEYENRRKRNIAENDQNRIAYE